MELEEIKKHWEEAGKKVNSKLSPTSRDKFLADLERANIISNLKPKFKVLEIGCGDGTHTEIYSSMVEEITAIDISDSLVEKARIRLKSKKNAKVLRLSVLDLIKKFKNNKFDCIISQRCLINLPTWKLQKKVLESIAYILKKNGILLLTEGFQDGLNAINELRAMNNLKKIKVVNYNKNFERQKFETFIKDLFEIQATVDYGFYLLLSRVFYPKLIYPKEPKHDSKFNKVAKSLSINLKHLNSEKYSYNLFYNLRKN